MRASQGAAASLAKLDDELHKEYHCQDFIDTVPYTARARGGVFNEELVMKTLLGAIIKRQDRKVIR